MATNEFLRSSLEHFKQQRQRLLAELRAVETTVHTIQGQLGETPDEPSDVGSGVGSINATAENAATWKPRPDEFFKKSHSEAAKIFLEKINHAISMDDLVDGLKSGNCKVGGKDPKKTLHVSLIGNARDFVKLNNGFIGLRSFYPGMAKLGRPKSGDKRKKLLAKRTQKKSAKPKSSQVTTATHIQNPGEVKSAIRAILGDHVARTPDDVLQAVEKRLGHPVKKIAVYGTLRKKDFEQVGDKYRLRPPAEGLPLQ